MRAAVTTDVQPTLTTTWQTLLFLLILTGITAVFVSMAPTVAAQDPAKQRPAKQRPAELSKNQEKDQEETKLKPRTVMLKTKDGVELRAFYFPSDQEKEAITVLLVHEWRGQASPYLQLVVALRDAGCAVLVPDYRGHGGSKAYTDHRGRQHQFDQSRMSKRDVQNIILMDLEKAKGFLKTENDEGLLNLNALVVVGVREGCVMASHWAARDWSFPSVGRMKQGQDVKALVMISPEKQIKGVAIDPVLKDPNLLNLPILIVRGKTSPQAKETLRIAKRIEGWKKKVGGGTASGFQLQTIDTSLSGPTLINEDSKVIPAIVKFIQDEVQISKNENPWIQRSW